MRIFIAGGSGAIGRVLVPMLVREGHQVVALSRTAERVRQLEGIGAEGIIGDVFNRAELVDVVTRSEPEIVIHQLTAFGAKDADPLAETIRIRIEGTRNLVEAARAAKARRFIAQSISFICTPSGQGLTDEATPLYLDAPEGIRPLAHAVSELERQSLESHMECVVLRYGWFYGLDTNYDPSGSIPNAIRRGRMSIVGEGSGVYSFIGLQDAANATMISLTRGAGVYNIVDDEPARLNAWLPFVANLLNAPAPGQVDADTARAKLGSLFVYTMNEQRGASNLKARQELGWSPLTSSWRDGFARLYTGSR